MWYHDNNGSPKEQQTVECLVCAHVHGARLVSCPAGQNPVPSTGCTKTRNGEIRNGKWGNAEMRKWGMENKSVAARGSAVSEAVAEAEDW